MTDIQLPLPFEGLQREIEEVKTLLEGLETQETATNNGMSIGNLGALVSQLVQCFFSFRIITQIQVFQQTVHDLSKAFLQANNYAELEACWPAKTTTYSFFNFEIFKVSASTQRKKRESDPKLILSQIEELCPNQQLPDLQERKTILNKFTNQALQNLSDQIDTLANFQLIRTAGTYGLLSILTKFPNQFWK